MIKVISFDVWNTLITPNKNYGLIRDQVIAEHLGLTLAEAIDLYSSTKKTLDSIALVTGTNFSSGECWRILHQQVCKIKSSVSLRFKVENKFKGNLPHLDSKLVNQLSDLKREGYILKICSNTNFISGKILDMELFLKSHLFSQTFYSDMTGTSKPFKGMFDNLLEEDIMPEEVLHIGDSVDYDGGAAKAGMNYFQIKNPADLYSKLVDGTLYSELWKLNNIDKRG